MGKLRSAKKAAEPIRLVLREALEREWRHLAMERIEDVRPYDSAGAEVLGAFEGRA